MILWQINKGHTYSRIAGDFSYLDSGSQVYFDYSRSINVKSQDEEILQQKKKGEIHFTYGDYDPI
jgi:hypothetical protein